MSETLQALEGRIGHAFRDRAHLEEALTHRSWASDHPGAGANNQRLEFLGDSVLQFILTQALFERFPKDPEGALTRRRALLLGGRLLAALARELKLDEYLRMGANEDAAGGRDRDGALEDALEAVVGAAFRDGGLEAARGVVLGIYGDLGQRLASYEAANPKGDLQEIVQGAYGKNDLRYTVIATAGLEHAREFEVAVDLGERRLGSGWGSSKREAEEEAARAALAELRTSGLER